MLNMTNYPTIFLQSYNSHNSIFQCIGKMSLNISITNSKGGDWKEDC
jgi:hypothetical protein